MNKHTGLRVTRDIVKMALWACLAWYVLSTPILGVWLAKQLTDLMIWIITERRPSPHAFICSLFLWFGYLMISGVYDLLTKPE